MKLHYRRCHVNNEWIHPVWCGMDRCGEKKASFVYFDLHVSQHQFEYIVNT